MRRLGAILWMSTLIVLASPVAARTVCHVAAFADTSVTVRESDGRARLTIRLLGGNPSCSGTVRWETVDDTAEAPGDYTARAGEASFATGDDREETITIPIIDDERDEPREGFEVRLTGSSGTITQTSDTPAVVTIRDNDQPPASPSPDGSPSEEPSPSPEPTGTESPTTSPTPVGEPSPSSTGVDGEGELRVVAPGPGAWVLLLLLVLAGAGGAIWYFLIRRPA